MDNAKGNQQRRRSLTPSSMPRTLWSSASPTKDVPSDDDHQALNVKVALRCRPLSEDEIRAGTSLIISWDELKQEVTATQHTAYKQRDRTFAFDKVFGPETQQKELYNNVVAPIVNEVLEGCSWTIFAYGQTGTGKTYTMEGEGRIEKNGQFHKDAGIIPRAVQQIFDSLDSERADYSVKVTFLEIYNEEITDLLAPDEGSKTPLFLMEDGKGSVFVRGLEEEMVFTADETYAILNKGSAKKIVAETLLSKQSNCSHTMLSITIQTLKSSPDGSELIKCGKLNLVDLAGSENILRSGALEMVRAREAGEINKSLLTLGRVVSALAENSGHVPYRESKLTRLLRNSLGGTTKTCMIATVSPSILSQEETLSTLDYASLARNIKNRPEVNQKVMKSMLLKDLYTQISHLKRELRKTRENNGVYVPQEDQNSEEARKDLYVNQQQLIVDLKDKLASTQRELTKTQQSLHCLEDKYQQAEEMNEEKENMIFNILCSGKALTERALELRSDLEGAASDVSTLFSQIECKKHLEDRNRHEIQNYYSQLTQQLEELKKAVSASATHQEQNLKVIQDKTQSFLTSKAAATDELLKQIQTLRDLNSYGVKHLDDSARDTYQNSQSVLSRLSSELSTYSSCIMDLIMKSSSHTNMINDGLKLNLNNLRSRLDAFMQQQEANQVRTYVESKSMSQSLLNFFKTLRVYINKLTFMEEDSQTITNQKLNAFTKKFEAFALDEERLIIEQMAELLASSRSRKQKLIQAAVDDIIDSVCKRTDKLSEVQSFTTDAEEKWTNYIERTEANYVVDSAVMEAGKGTLGEDLQCCITKSTEVAKLRKIAEESLLQLFKKNAESVDSFIRNRTKDNEKMHTRFSSVASSVLEETDEAGKNAMLSVEYTRKLDNEASEQINFSSSCCLKDAKEMDRIHWEKVVEISRNARKSLVDDYSVDDSSCSSLRKRNYNLPSKERIESLMNTWLGNSMESSQPDAVPDTISYHVENR